MNKRTEKIVFASSHSFVYSTTCDNHKYLYHKMVGVITTNVLSWDGGCDSYEYQYYKRPHVLVRLLCSSWVLGLIPHHFGCHFSERKRWKMGVNRLEPLRCEARVRSNLGDGDGFCTHEWMGVNRLEPLRCETRVRSNLDDGDCCCTHTWINGCKPFEAKWAYNMCTK